MIPAIYPGDHILIQQKAGKLKPGEILVARSFNHLIVHRLIETKGDDNEILILKGDNNKIPDPPVSSENIIGCVIKTKPTTKSKLLRRFRSK
ncbi:MAG: signal peptidase I [Bacteroidales bacterium]|nr:signal peptidase I [Bacteroidales bacterium]